MAEYIEREALLNRLKTKVKRITPIEESRDMFYHDSGVNGALTAAMLEVENAPAADVVPVVRGRWIPIKVPTGIEFLGIKEMVVGFIRCSECYMEFDISCEWYSKYCPNCGCRMDGGNE